MEQLLDFIEKDTSIRSHDMETVFAWLADALAFFISLGNRVATDVGTFTPAIKAGALPPEFRASDIPEAVLRMNFIVNKPLIHALRKEADFEVKTRLRPMDPEIWGYSPAGGDRFDGPLEQPALMSLYGVNLRFASSDPE